MIPHWLRDHIETTTGTKVGGISRAVRAAVCRKCGAHVIRGLDDDRCASDATCDPNPISPLGEALALAAGLTTYDLTWAGRYELDPRDQSNIPSPRRHPVVAAHRCGTTWPADDSAPPPRRRPTHIRGDQCPF